MDLNEKRVIVTGGASGIGMVLVDQLVDEGAIVGVLDIDQKALLRLGGRYSSLYCRACDVSQPDSVETAVDDFFKEFGRIDVLVNNAGIVHSALLVALGPRGIVSHDIEMWDKIISTNLSSVFYVTTQVVRRMVSQRTKGVIVNVSSISAVGNIGQSAYSAAKAGVVALTVTWAKELGTLGIRVAGIAPGFTKTDTTIGSMSETILSNWIRDTPLRRMAKPKEIADGIVFILKSDFFNGRVLEIDGGLRI
ncbi:MAG: SDR family oxidoreductase [Deltaproteobacteria bacterium]|nr:SDR family oxidoreductase [Deltaproteobacteria bacterium]